VDKTLWLLSSLGQELNISSGFPEGLDQLCELTSEIGQALSLTCGVDNQIDITSGVGFGISLESTVKPEET